MYIYLDGSWVREDEAKISVMDIAVLRGFGIFDFLRTYGKKPFRLDDHIERFFNSARLMGMSSVHTHEEIAALITEGIEKNGFEHTDIKMIQTGGPSTDGFTPEQRSSFILYFFPAHINPKEAYEKGVSVETVYLLRQLPEVKTINYAASIVAVSKASKHGAIDILHTDKKGNIFEGTRNNFFIVKDGDLITANTRILFGITRKVILEIIEKRKLSLKFRLPNISELSKLSEAFITSSTKEIMPVVKINDVTIGKGTVGHITLELMKDFNAITAM